MKKNILTLLLLFTLFGIPFQSIAQTNYNRSQMKREKLGRGVVAVRKTVKTYLFVGVTFPPTPLVLPSIYTVTEQKSIRRQ